MIISRKSTRDFSGVDRYKNLLVKKYSAKAGQTIVNNLTGEDYVSLFLACAELGLVTIISEMTPFSEKLFYERKYKIPFYIPEKIGLLLPIDYYIGEESIYTTLADTVLDENGWTDDDLNNDIFAKPDSILFRTSNENKIIEHTHSYMLSLGKRNSKLLKGNVQVEKDIFFLITSLISDVNIQYEYDVTTDIVESILELIKTSTTDYFDLTSNNFNVFTSNINGVAYSNDDDDEKTYYRAIIDIANRVQQN